MSNICYPVEADVPRERQMKLTEYRNLRRHQELYHWCPQSPWMVLDEIHYFPANKAVKLTMILR